MSLVQAFVLGIVQGVAEFLPVSSSGHLVLVPAILGWDGPSLGFDVLLHLATLVAVVAYFRRDLWRMVRAFFSRSEGLATERKLAWLIIIATVPTGIIGLTFKDFFESLFSNVTYVGVFLLVTAAFLALAEKLSRKALHDPADMGFRHAIAVGVAQGMAIAPGISRSGTTMAAGLGAGLDREQAARFSFLLSVPIILLAGAKTALDVATHSEPLPGIAVCIVGFLAAAISGYAVIAGLLSWLRRRSLLVFSAYCAVVGTAVLVWQFIV
ncbi:MAG: undecaprenyl-diphosphatase UppP [Coriobacteriia bacterium]|nr:undecaprenyl-diphosphatase UppP [Coriobacteriia bacterium]